MPKYLTISAYKRLDDGISLSGLSDIALANKINDAEALIDDYVGFDMKRGGFEPHEISVQRRFEQSTLKTFDPQSPVPLRVITRYRIQVSNVSSSGAGFFANISSADCVINNDANYVEIVPLQAVTYSLSPVLLQLGLDPPIVQMDCKVGYYIPMIGDDLIDSGDLKTFCAVEGYWASDYTVALHLQPATLPPVPPVVYVNGVIQNSGYTINYKEGSVTFSVARDPSDIVTADYTKTIPSAIRAATIIQTSHMLGQRALNQLGLSGLEAARSGDQDVRRPRIYASSSNSAQDISPALCDQAKSALNKLMAIPVA
jgi:hypothetical protein